jgi:5-formyltetrahydrofolate cyclo-ligase
MTDQPAHSDPNSAKRRAELRRRCIAARVALPEAWRHDASRRILAALEEFCLARAPGVLAFCWPIRAEVDCRPLAERLIAAGWRVTMPTVVASDAPMSFRRWQPGMAMTQDPYGIPVPAAAETLPPDVALLPLVAFDAAGYRLGYGGGYFDRTLAACAPRPLAVGVGFALAEVPSIHPEPHDIPLDAVVTEYGLRLFSPA